MKRILWSAIFFVTAAVIAFGVYAAFAAAPARKVEFALRCTPAAAVRIDGSYRGLTPLSISDLASGKHVLRLERDGYSPLEKVLEAPVGGDLDFVLERIPPAKLSITSSPDDADIFINGAPRGSTPTILEGLQPGRYHVELVKTNYFPAHRDLSLQSGQEVDLSVGLDHRQERAYRARLKADPGDIAAYNDLGELLYVLGRYAEAAEVYVQAWITLDEEVLKNKNNEYNFRYNLGKLRREARNKHDHPEFQKLLDHATIGAIFAGHDTRYLIEDFHKINGRSNMPEYEKALDLLVAHHAEECSFLLKLAPLYHKVGLVRKAILLIDKVSSVQEKSFHIQKNCLSAGIDLYKQSPENKDLKESLAKWVARVDALAKAPALEALALYEKARIHYIEGDFKMGAELSEKAIEKQKNKVREGLWRLELAKVYKQHKEYAKASQHLHAILLIDEMKKRREFQEVRPLIKSLPEKFRKPPQPKLKPEPLKKD